MKLVFAGTTLFDTISNLHGQVVINSTNVADVAQLAQATQPAIFDRGNRTNIIQATAWVPYSGANPFANTEYAAATLASYIGGSGTLVITCGEVTETQQVATAANAVIQNVTTKYVGTMLIVTYTIVCGLILGGSAPGIITYAPLALIAFQAAITSGASSVAVTFSTPFGAGVTPTLSHVVGMPSSASIKIYAEADLSTLSNTGVTFRLSAPAPASGYVLHGSAAA